MKSKILMAIFVMCSILAHAQTEKYSTYYYQRASLFEVLEVTSEDILFVGNSITDGGEFFELFDNPKVKNRGISGDIIQGVYDRLPALTKGQPAKIFLMIGINNVPRGANAEEIAEGIQKIVREIKKESPKTKIYLEGVLPVNPDLNKFGGHTSKWQMIPDINKAVKKVAKEEGVTFIDLFSHFVNEEGKMNKKYTNDGLHLLGAGYLLWRDIVKPYVNE